MAQDTALLRYLLKWARRAPWSWSQRDLAFAFDWTGDYISSNATIGRTGYDMNVSGNVTTGRDGDGSDINFNGNKDGAWLWSSSNIWWSANTTPAYTQATSFTIKAKFKFSAFPATQSSWLFGSNFDAVININSWWNLVYWLRWSSTVLNSQAISINTLYDWYLVYDSSTTKFYGYLWTSWGASTLLNVWWTTWPATFATNAWWIWDDSHASGNTASCNKYIYHACIRNRALTKAEIDADIALWNTTKQDPTIVAYYVPENLQYNTQYLTNPTALDQSNWIKTGTTSVTANTTVAPDWTTTADTVTIAGTATQWCNTVITALTWSSLASKTFIVKAFVKVSAWTDTFRLQCSHNGVASYYGSDLTATTARQEFTFTQAFTSSTSGTWITIWLVNDTWAWWAVLEVWNVRCYLVNETLRDESPNIWWFIGRKTQQVLSCRTKPNIDAVDSALSQILISNPYFYTHIRRTDNQVVFRFDGSRVPTWSISATSSALWNWFRNKVHILWVVSYTWDTLVNKIYINWVFAWSWTSVKNIPTAFKNANMKVGNFSSWYYNWNIRDARIYTFTWSFTATDALAIYNGGEPTSAWITKYLHYRPPVGEVGTTTQDLSPNDRDWTLNGGVTRIYL